jgi:hypothetical protein
LFKLKLGALAIVIVAVLGYGLRNFLWYAHIPSQDRDRLLRGDELQPRTVELIGRSGLLLPDERIALFFYEKGGGSCRGEAVDCGITTVLTNRRLVQSNMGRRQAIPLADIARIDRDHWTVNGAITLWPYWKRPDAREIAEAFVVAIERQRPR